MKTRFRLLLRHTLIAACITVMVINTLPTQAQEPLTSIAEQLAALDGAPCPDSTFTCVTLAMPLDHFNPSDGRIQQVTFGILPATGTSKGLFVTATGGPGTSGLAAADSYIAAFDPSITEHFDIVFFDQRGAALSGNLQCATAAAAYYQTDATSDEALVSAARTFAQDCITEMGIEPALLPFYGTAQAAADLETFRTALGSPVIWLYGESYGTQLAQTYAAAYPAGLRGLILDSAVDLTLSGTDYLAEQAQAFGNVLQMTLQACEDDAACAAAFPDSDPAAFYDDLTAELSAAPAPLFFPTTSGKVQRTFTHSDLETVVIDNLYTEGGRMRLQRGLAAAARGDLAVLARMAYSAYGLNAETLIATPDPTYSDGLYYAVECNDYHDFSGTPDERAAAYLRAGAEHAGQPLFAAIFYGDLPCAFWPTSAPPERPQPLTAPGIPTLVLGATADPATPVENGQRIVQRLDNGYLMTTEGGAHVIFGRGDECPDLPVTDFLVNDVLPAEPETRCEGVVARAYVPLSPQSAAAFTTPLEALNAAYDDLFYLPDYVAWDGTTLELVGCPYGGSVAFAPSAAGEQFRLSQCAFSEGFILTGSGSTDYTSGDFTLDVVIGGLHEGRLAYVQDADGNNRISGIFGGESLTLSG